MSEPTHCTFCGARAAELLGVPSFEAACCAACAGRLGTMLADAPDAWVRVWPRLVDDEDEDEPEPRVRRGDGQMVELRSLTAELKRELPVEKRAELANTLGELGLHREALLEYAFVLSAAPERALAQRALDALFRRPFVAPNAIELVRARLLPS